MVEVNYSLSDSQVALIAVLVVWDLVWKCLAAWKAVENKDRFSFVLLILINSAGIIPILYLVYNRYVKEPSQKG